jgi:hypothetical protein
MISITHKTQNVKVLNSNNLEASQEISVLFELYQKLSEQNHNILVTFVGNGIELPVLVEDVVESLIQKHKLKFIEERQENISKIQVLMHFGFLEKKNIVHNIWQV